MIDIDNLELSITDPESGTVKPVLKGISLSIQRGEAVGLVGESGSGKSMTLRCILGIEPRNSTVSGDIVFDGENLRALPAERMRRLRADKIALISQNPHAALNPVLPIETYLLEGMADAHRRNAQATRARAADMLEQVGIRSVDRVLKAFPHQLSGGMLQRVVIAGAISGKPGLLLADEPTTALDVTTQAEVAAILDEKRRDLGMSMIFVTHDLDLAAAVSDRLAVMRHGEIVEIGTPEQIRDSPQHPYTRMLMSIRPTLSGTPAGGTAYDGGSTAVGIPTGGGTAVARVSAAGNSASSVAAETQIGSTL
ncbi:MULTISPECIES: ABC transporter ATP-binding protein [Arthrobacter]|uniref:ABC transporter ATP-binding protein n=1 Tax=Arthrobacter terricola TaxID=2547396 RepID=A0A4V6PID0_9MICC|nr:MULTISPECIES: ABC transporter ATP-binding protein [Arthrobacter]MBT8162282.1 ABC transporter ATP-binding protein [Arthrobacter sp. GN70]TDF92244.1 ABC transporter ATP-binding protein [Arthrobacter terricola]